MNGTESAFLRRIYAEIIQGISPVVYQKDKILVKHFTSLDQGCIDEKYDQFYKDAISQGLPTSEERLKLLIEQSLWSSKDEAWIQSHRNYIENMNITKSKLAWQSEIENMAKEIATAEKELENKIASKRTLMGLVAETYANKRINQSYIFYALRRADDINQHYFDPDIFEELGGQELNDLTSLYNDVLSNFKLLNLKKIGLAPFFQNTYAICNDDPYTFYGRAVCELTYYQTEIFTYGRFFKSILGGDAKPSDDIIDDPEAIISWYMSTKNAQSMVGEVDDNVNGATAIYGAKRKDITSAGGTLAQSPVQKALKEGKKSLNMQEVMSHHRL